MTPDPNEDEFDVVALVEGLLDDDYLFTIQYDDGRTGYKTAESLAEMLSKGELTIGGRRDFSAKEIKNYIEDIKATRDVRRKR